MSKQAYPGILSLGSSSKAFRTINQHLRDSARKTAFDTLFYVVTDTGSASDVSLTTTEVARVTLPVQPSMLAVAWLLVYEGVYNGFASNATTERPIARLYQDGVLVTSRTVGPTSAALGAGVNFKAAHSLVLTYVLTPPSVTQTDYTFEIRDLKDSGAANTNVQYLGATSAPSRLTFIELRAFA